MAPLRLLRLANPVVRAVLGSPGHRLLSGGLLVLTYRGHRSGRTFRIPLRYATMPGDRIVALAVAADGKLWWRSFSQPAPATLLVGGAERAVSGRLLLTFLLILTLALPPLIARPEDVSRLAAAILAIGYLCAFLVPIAGGALWDATLAANAAFYPLIAFGIAVLAIAATLDFTPTPGPGTYQAPGNRR